MSLEMVVAMDHNNVLGYKCITEESQRNKGLLWHVPEDMVHFRQLTSNHIVIMGRKTFEQMGHRPLPHRINIVFSRQSQQNNGDTCENLFFVQNVESLFGILFHLSFREKEKESFGCPVAPLRAFAPGCPATERRAFATGCPATERRAFAPGCPATERRAFVIGGNEIFALLMPHIKRIHLTKIWNANKEKEEKEKEKEEKRNDYVYFDTSLLSDFETEKESERRNCASNPSLQYQFVVLERR